MEFKEGMRVLALRPVGDMHAVDQIGVVIHIGLHSYDSEVCVEFDNYIRGHHGNHSKIKGKPGHCWWVSPHFLTPIVDNNEALTFLLKEEF